jgi:hypothetical protein
MVELKKDTKLRGGTDGVHGDVQFIPLEYHRVILLRVFFIKAVRDDNYPCIHLTSLIEKDDQENVRLGNVLIPKIEDNEILLACPSGAFVYMDLMDNRQRSAAKVYAAEYAQNQFRAVKLLLLRFGKISSEHKEACDDVIKLQRMGKKKNGLATKKSSNQCLLFFVRGMQVFGLYARVMKSKTNKSVKMSQEMRTALGHAVCNIASKK